jgi:hypothetical protein
MITIKQFLAIRISKQGAMIALLAVVLLLFASMFLPHNHRGSDKAHCIMNQRNIQQALRAYAEAKSLDIGDRIAWPEIIGIGQYFEKYPECPIHGKTAYHYSSTVPPVGVLVAPCKDVKHKPASFADW